MPDVVSSNPLHRFRVVLLAAGQGSRLGGLPKSLLRLHDQTLLERQLRALIAAGATHIVVVTGFYYPEIEAELARFQPQPTVTIEIHRHQHPEQGQQSSVMLGLRAIAERAGPTAPVMVALADQPLLDEKDYQECLNAFINRPAERSIVYPVCDQQRGNPVILSAATVERVLKSGIPCREFINTHPELVFRFPTQNDHFTFDIDEPDDLDRLSLRLGFRLSTPRGF